jgi:hypothetical protein
MTLVHSKFHILLAFGLQLLDLALAKGPDAHKLQTPAGQEQIRGDCPLA